MGFKAWQTPPDFFKALDEEFHFTLDAAASHENALCDMYCTPDGLYLKDVHGHGGEAGKGTPEDGLTTRWNGFRVFCNPPYDSSLYQWVEKASKFEAEVAVLLLPPSIDTKWFQSMVTHIGEPADHMMIWKTGITIDFLPSRLRFWRDGKPGKAPRAGNLLAIFRR